MEVDVLSRLNYIRVWFMFSPGKTWREEITQLPFRQPKRRGRHEQSGHESAAGHMLTIATVALERHDGFSQAFVANRAANAAAGKWDFDFRHKILPAQGSQRPRQWHLNVMMGSAKHS